MEHFDSFRLKNVRVVDPERGETREGELCVRGGVFAAETDGPAIDCGGLCAAPGLVDMHVHLREPGQTEKEDIASGCTAAAAGGVTTVACMANTTPPTDAPERVKFILGRAEGMPARVLPIACVTEGMAGERLTDFAALREAGAAAFSDDGRPVTNAALMLAALQTGELIIAHSEDASLTDGRAINAGPVADKLGLPGRPACAEEYMVARDALLALATGGRVHIAHVSTALSVDIIRRAKAAGARISCETAPHYFTFTEDDVLRLGTDAKMFPPLRTARDREAIIEGLADGTIDAVATDHAPHTAAEKALGLEKAPGGVVGLETSLAASITALGGRMSLPEIFRRLSYTPARLLGIDGGSLAPGARADIVLFDPEEAFTVDPAKFRSKGRSTPFRGMTLRGAVKATYLAGKLVYKA